MTSRYLAAMLIVGMASSAAIPASAQSRSDRAALADARPDGPALDCIPLNQIRQSRVRSDQVIDFYAAGGKVYRNTLPYSCQRLGFERAFAYQTSLNRLCSVDIITVIDQSAPGIPGPSCGLGVFQPITGIKP